MIQVQGMKLDQFFEIYSMISGRTVLRPYNMQGVGSDSVTLKAQTDWTRREAIYAMDAALALNGIAMIPIGDKFVKAVPQSGAGVEGTEISNLGTNVTENLDHFVTQMIEVKTVKASELAPLLQTFSKIPNAVTAFDNNQTLVIREHASNVKRMLEVVHRIDVQRESDYKLEVIPIKYGKVIDLYNTMNSLISGTGGGAAGTAAAAGAPPAQRQTGRPQPFGRGGPLGGFGGSYGRSGYGGYGGYGGGYGGYGGGYTPYQAAQPTPVGTAQQNFQNRLQQIVRRAAGESEVKVLEDARIVPDERSNSLLIFANKRDMEMITNIVGKVDVLLAQVLIEGIVLEVELGDSKNVGVSMVQNPNRFGRDFTGAGGFNNGPGFLSGITNLANNLPSGFSYFGKIGSDLEVAVSAIATDRKANIMSRPRIQTSHAIPGEFTIAEIRPFVTGTYDYGGFYGGGVGNRSIVERIPIGVQMYVTPFITPEGLVVMEISQNFDQFGGNVTIDNNPIPIVNNRAATATLTVRDGDTIMMGGFISQERRRDKSGVPVLKDIPGLGVLFRSKNDDSVRKELIVLLKATVLKDPEDAAILATSERSQLPGVQEAEKEIQEDERKRLRKLRGSRK